MARRLVVQADGGSRGNPGPAAYGALVRDADDGSVLARVAEHIGVASNNVAEYRGAIAGLEAAREIDPEADVEVRMDSRLVVEQLSGRWQVKHPDMRTLAKRALAVWPAGHVTYTWVPRAENRDADRLVNEALDLARSGQPWVDTGPVEGAIAAGTDDPLRAEPPAESVLDLPPNRLVGWAHDLGEPTLTLLLRHGETAHTRDRRFSGSGGADPSLSEAGQAQALAAATALAGTDLAVVLTSPLARAVQTAEAVAAVTGATVRVDDGVAECAFGEWEGLTFAEVEEGWPELLADWLASTAVAPPGGESFDVVERRVRRSRDRLLARHPARTVVVVSHVTPIKMFVRLALEAPSRSLYRMEVAPASLSAVAWFTDGNASVRSLNDTAHLAGLLPDRHV